MEKEKLISKRFFPRLNDFVSNYNDTIEIYKILNTGIDPQYHIEEITNALEMLISLYGKYFINKEYSTISDRYWHLLNTL